MDEKDEFCCPNCGLQYQLKGLSSEPNGNIPLLLSCYHSMCENCISNAVRIGEPSACKICQRKIVITDNTLTENKTRLHEVFPVNVYILGQLTSQHTQDAQEKPEDDGNDSQASMRSTDLTQEVQQQASCSIGNEQRTRIREGQLLFIYISHIVNPHNFFVQRVCDQRLAMEMIKEFRNATTLPKPSHVSEGQMYLVYNGADIMWQRCRVENIGQSDANTPLVRVFCVDYGATISVTEDSLRVLPSARVQSPPPLAINCSLANCQPVNGIWTDEDTSLVQDIINRKRAVINVRRLKPASSGSIQIQCDVTTLETGVSIAHALVFHHRAYMPNRRLLYPIIKALTKNPILLTSNSDFKPDSVKLVHITHVTSPDKFYVRKQRLYEKLCEDMQQEYRWNESITVYLPKCGMVCAVNLDGEQFSESGWSRCMVRDLLPRGYVRVHLPDIGASTVVHLTSLKYLHTKFTNLKALAVKCHLAGVVPLNGEWSPGSVTFLQNYEGQLLELHVEDNHGPRSIGVTLYEREGSGRVICINNEMVRKEFAVSLGTCSPVTEIKKDCKAEVKRLEVNIIRYQSPSVIYVWLEQQRKAFADLFKHIQKYYTTEKPLREFKWKIGDRCCAFCDRSKTWRRAVITQLDNEIAQVCFTDFARSGAVSVNDLKVLVPKFDAYGDAAIKCHLSGVMSVDKKWPSLAKEYFKKLLDSQEKLFINKTGNIENNSVPVEIWVYHTTKGGALDIDISEWRCLNNNIIDEGFALPDKSHATTDDNEAGGSEACGIEAGGSEARGIEAGCGEHNILPIHNSKGTIHDWLQLEPLLTKGMPDEENHTSVNCFIQENVIMSNSILKMDWLPVEPLNCKEFTATPIYIDKKGNIYVHTISQKDNLDIIRNTLDLHHNNTNPKAKFAEWTIGNPCIAMYSVDNKFYRGRVKEVNKETCLIHYIDYGYEEVCSFSNLMKISRYSKLYQIPIQSNKCILDRIELSQEQLSTILDYLRDCVIQKQCLVKVTGKPFEGHIAIELILKNLNMNDHLVEYEMASYIDVHENVVKRDTIFITYPKNEDEFKCNVTRISPLNTLHLSILRSTETNKIYNKLFKNIQETAETLPPLNGIYANKACICISHKDGLWHRASMLQYSRNTCKVTVLYVDHGNIVVVNLADIREIRKDWTRLPPSAVMAKFDGMEINPQAYICAVSDLCTDTLLEKGPFEAKIVGYENNIALLGRLKNENGDLIHEKLIASGMFVNPKSTN